MAPAIQGVSRRTPFRSLPAFMAVAGVFDALTTKRPLYAARQYLEDKKGREFDPACVEACLRDGLAGGICCSPFEELHRAFRPDLYPTRSFSFGDVTLLRKTDRCRR